MNKQELLNSLSAEERQELIAELQAKDKEERVSRREAYEGLRLSFLDDVEEVVIDVVNYVSGFHTWLCRELEAFRSVMAEYGQLRKEDQQSFTIGNDAFKVVVKSNKVKKFDERADMAAVKLVEYLRGYMAESEKGADDPMYQLAMTLLERNKQGDLDYKSISKLYDLEMKFDERYKAIMDLFRESNVVMATAVNYYFYKRDDQGVWRQLEPSFCRL
jgi:hypothetical protein